MFQRNCAGLLWLESMIAIKSKSVEVHLWAMYERLVNKSNPPRILREATFIFVRAVQGIVEVY